MDDNSLSMTSIAAEGEEAHFDWIVNRFRSLVTICEEKLAHGETGTTLKVLVEEVQRLAAETDAEVVSTLYTDALGEPPADTFVGAMRWNVEQIVQALQ